MDNNLSHEAILLQISEYENNIENFRTQLNEASEILVKDINIFIKEKYQNDIESNVKTKVEISKQLGIEKLRELKTELAELIGRTPSLVDKHMKDDIWVHKNYSLNVANEFNQKYNIKHKFNKSVTNILCELYGYAGALLIKYGYENSSSANWEKQHDSEIPKYKYWLTLSKGLDISINLYVHLLEQQHDILVKLNKAIRQKEQQEALDLWDQA